MVFIYHRLFRPHITDFENIPRIIRNILFKLNSMLSNRNRKFLQQKEVKKPLMKTPYPGPRMKNLVNDMELITSDFLKISNFMDYEKSFGNYFQDCDGNIFLDLSNEGNNCILGYNSKYLFENFQKNKDLYNKSLNNKNDSLTNYFCTEQLNCLENTITSILPLGLNKVIFHKNPEDLAYILSMLRRGNIQRELKSNNLIFQEMQQIFENREEEENVRNLLTQNIYSNKKITDNYKILRINSKTNGNNFSESCFEEVKIFKNGPFPILRYPLKENMMENYNLENICLEETEKILKSNFDITAIVVVAVGDGETWATPTYFHKLRKLASLYNADFIVDERKTGLTVGRLWQHELWNLQTPPDFVIFGRKFMNSGLFIRNEALPDKISNDICGNSNFDFNNLMLLNDTLNICKKKNLFEKSEKAGEYFKLNLKEINKKINIFKNVRGKAGLIAIDIVSGKGENFEDNIMVYKKLIKYLRNVGIYVEGNSKTNTLYIRPNAIIENRHYDILLNVLEELKI